MDKIISQIKTLLVANMKTARGIKEIYEGDPWNIPENSLPAITISPISTSIETSDNVSDQSIFTINVNLILNARTYFNVSATKENGLINAVKIMEERNTDISPKSDTIAGVLREKLDCDSDYVLKADVGNINYTFSERREFPTIEASLTVVAKSKIYLR